MYNNFHLIGNNKNNKLSYPLLSIINYNILFSLYFIFLIHLHHIIIYYNYIIYPLIIILIFDYTIKIYYINILHFKII